MAKKRSESVVIVLGYSNGSLILQNYLTKDKALADYFIIGATRIIAPPEIVNAYTNKLDFQYVDGTKFTTYTVSSKSMPYFNVLTKLQLDELKNYSSLLTINPSLARTF